MEVSELVDALDDQGQLLRKAANGGDLDIGVPTCPGWNLRDLLLHIGQVHRWATTYVAEMAGQLVAFASCGEQRDPDLAAQGYAGEFAAVYVLNAAQRRGVGTALMRTMMGDLTDRGLAGFTLWVPRDNIPARSLYEQLGGRLVGQRTETGPHGSLTEVAYGWPA